MRPVPGRDLDEATQQAAAIARKAAGIATVDPYSKTESEKLLQPWLGSGLDLGDLPVPRLIVLKLEPGRAVDVAALRKALDAVPGATVDDTLSQLTERIERKLQEVPGLDYLRSYTTAGQTTIFVNLKGSVAARDLTETWYQVRKKVSDILGKRDAPETEAVADV